MTVDIMRLEHAIAAKECGTLAWNDRHEYGPCQVGLMVGRDYADFFHIPATTAAMLRNVIEHDYTIIVLWHLQRLLDRYASDDAETTIRRAAAAWNAGVAGEKRGLGVLYADCVYNLYSADQTSDPTDPTDQSDPTTRAGQ